jgi:hypothetical protein
MEPLYKIKFVSDMFTDYIIWFIHTIYLYLINIILYNIKLCTYY